MFLVTDLVERGGGGSSEEKRHLFCAIRKKGEFKKIHLTKGGKFGT